MQTQAVVIPEANRIELQTVTLKDAAAADVVIETHYTSISAGTERMVLGGMMPHPMLQPPLIPGYETVGKVVEVGADAPDDLLGQWVYIGGAMCYEGVNAAWGGQSARLHVAAERVIRLHDIEPQQGVLLALTATSLHGVDVLNVQAGQRVLVIGQGPVGQLAARIACERGAWVAVTDKNPQRLEKSVGDVVINVDQQSVTDAISEPVDAIIEASGSMAALSEALALLGNGGTVLLLGYYQKLDVPYMPLFLKEASLLTAKEWAQGDLQRSRDLIAAGTLDVAPLLTHRVPIRGQEDVMQGYELALHDQDCLKLVFDWST